MYPKKSIKYFYKCFKIHKKDHVKYSNMIANHDNGFLSFTEGSLDAYSHVVRDLLIDYYYAKYEFPFAMDAGNRAIELIFGGTE